MHSTRITTDLLHLDDLFQYLTPETLGTVFKDLQQYKRDNVADHVEFDAVCCITTAIAAFADGPLYGDEDRRRFGKAIEGAL